MIKSDFSAELIFIIYFVILPIVSSIYFVRFIYRKRMYIIKKIVDSTKKVPAAYRFFELKFIKYSLMVQVIISLTIVATIIYIINNCFMEGNISFFGFSAINYGFSIVQLFLFLITFYYFCYRQHKLISESYLICNRIGIYSLLKISFIVEVMFLYAMSHSQGSGATGISEVSYAQAFMLTISAMLIIHFIFTLFGSLNVNYLLDNAFSKINNILEIVEQFSILKTHSSEDVKLLSNETIWAIETMYQIGQYTIQKNLHLIFDTYINMLSSIFKKINEDFFYNENVSLNIEICKNLYQNILAHHKLLIMLLAEKDRSRSVKSAVDRLIRFYPSKMRASEINREGAILDEYFKIYYDILEYFSEKNRNVFQHVIKKIKVFSSRDVEKNNLLVVFKSLIIRAIDTENLKFLTELCYIQKQFIEGIKDASGLALKEHITTNDLVRRATAHANNMTIKDNEKYEGRGLYVLMQAVVKSIELGQYSITGFLIKYIVSNYRNSDLIKRVYLKIRENNAIDCKLEAVNLTKIINEDFCINELTSNYCLRKFTILLLIQQQYSQLFVPENELDLDIFNNDDNNEEFKKEYCLSKIYEAKDKYGMLSVKELLKKDCFHGDLAKNNIENYVVFNSCE